MPSRTLPKSLFLPDQKLGFPQPHHKRCLNMASAAERVLAVPELLEHILLNVYRSEKDEMYKREKDSRSSPRLRIVIAKDGTITEFYFGNPANGLFTLQRVNTTFCQTILGSSKLRYFMDIQREDHDPRRSKASILRNPVSFEILWLRPTRTRIGRNKQGRRFVEVDFIFDTSVAPSLGAYYKSSWCDFKVARCLAWAHLTTKVRYRDTRQILGKTRYCENYAVSVVDGTLGDIIGLLNIKRRSVERDWIAAMHMDLPEFLLLLGNIVGACVAYT